MGGRNLRRLCWSAALAAGVGAATLLTGCGGGGGADSVTTNPAGVPLVGSFGGTQSGDSALPAALALTAQGGQITLPCGASVRINGPLTPDTSGKVSASGTETEGLPRVPGDPIPVSVAGSVTGQTLTLTVTPSGGTGGTYVLVRDRPAPPFTGACAV